MQAFDLATVMAAFIGAVALLRTATIGYNEKRQRAHWFFDDYIGAVGRYVECRTTNTKEDYYVWFFKYYTYADDFVENSINEIDSLIKNEQWEGARKAILTLTKYYRNQYSLSQYLPKKKWRHLHSD